MKKIFLFFTIFFCCITVSFAQNPGSLDPSFGNNTGIVKTDMGARFAYNSYARQVLIQPNGSIYLILEATYISKRLPNGSLDSSYGFNGYSRAVPLDNSYASLQPDGKILIVGSSNSLFYVVRINTNGLPDSTFGNNGIQTVSFAPQAVTVQNDGKIVIAGGGQGFAVARYNSDGSPDNTFNGSGLVITDFVIFLPPNQSGYIEEIHSAIANAISVQADGKLVAGGRAAKDGNGNSFFAFVRYNTNGSVDSTFGNNGKQLISFGPNAEDIGYSLAIQNNGKIVMAGLTNKKFALVRCNMDGSLDNSFNGTGKQTANLGSDALIGNSVAIQSDGKIVVAGYTLNAGNNDFALARFTITGIPDNTFDNDGILTTDFNNFSDDYAGSLVIQNDGKLVVAGYSYIYTPAVVQHLAVSRYNSNGSLDISFDNDGKLEGDIQQGYTELHATAIQTDGKIVAAGLTWNGTDNDFVVVRYRDTGVPDSTFNNDGVQIADFGASDLASSIVIQPDGKIVVAGTSGSQFAVARYNADGSPDNTFNGSGKLISSIGFSDVCLSVALQSDGKIVMAGFTYTNTNYDSAFFAVVRLNTNGTFDNTFSGDGKQLTDFGAARDFASSVAIQTDGKVVVSGYSYLNNNDYFSIARYNTDGSPDTTFSHDGKQNNAFGPGDYFGSSLAIQNDGKIIIAGYSLTEFSSDYLSAAARYKTNGDLDNTFSNDGFQTGYPGFGKSVALGNNGKIAVGGSSNDNYSLVIFKNDGNPDSTFNGDGIEITRVGSGSSSIQSIAFADNKLYATGYGQFPGTLGVIARYLLAENKSPAVNISSPGNNVVYTAPASITINAAASDSDGTIKYVKFYNGGTFLKTDSTSPYTFTMTNVAAGNYSLVAKATDNIGLTGSSASIAVTVSAAANKAPVVNIISPANNIVYTSTATITINAAASDSDGTISYVKFYNGVTLLSTDSSSPYTYTMVNATAGNYSLVAKATDNKGLTSSSASIAVAVSVPANKAPVVSITSPAKNGVYYLPATININAAASDSDGSISNVKFYDGATLLATDSTSPYSYALNNLVPGIYSYTAQATDNKGLFSSSSSVTITILNALNKAPVTSILSPANNSVYYAPATITLNANATDTDGSINNVKFYNGATLLTTDSTSPYNYILSNVLPGNYSYSAQATDNKGLFSSSESVQITILSNKAPVVNITSPANNAVFSAPASITINAAASDTGGTIRYVDFYNGTTLLNRDSTIPYSYTWANVADGNYSLTAKATDNHGLATTSAVVPVNVRSNGTLEAEEAVLNGAVVASNQPGFTGSGFADYVHASGDFIEWTVNAPTGGSFLLQFRYANGGTANRPLQLQVNGVVINPGLGFPPTGSFATWSLSSATVSLIAGTNKIRLTTIGSNGPNVDNLTVTIVNTPTLEAEEAVLNGAVVASNQPGFSGSGFADYIHASGDFIEWTFNASTAGPFLLQFRYANGGTTDRPLQLQVNGVVINPGLGFPPTGGFANWSLSSATVSLVAGTNKIRLTTMGSNGPNVDNLAVTIANPETLEAEEAVLNGAVIASNQPGFTGSGFADYVHASGDFIEWTVNASIAGTFSLQFRYANGGSANRPLQLQVDGVVINASLDFSPTGSFTTWSVSSTTTPLSAGTHKIRLTTIGSNGPNVDHLVFGINNSIQSLQRPVTQKNAFLSSPGILKAFVSPNPIADKAKLIVTSSSKLPVTLQLVDILGRNYRSVRFLLTASNTFDFSVNDLSSGSYIILVKQGNFSTHARMIVMKK